MSAQKTHKIVIVGGGAGGLELATRLGRKYRNSGQAEIHLVDRQHAHLWKPLLHEVAAGTLNSNEDEMSYLALAAWNHFSFHLGPLESIDRHKKTITVGEACDADGDPFMPSRELAYDYLVLALGSVTNDFGTPGVSEHCYFLDSRAEADRFHQDLVRACYAADAQTEPLRDGQLHVAIAGAGATGVELAAELYHSMRTLVGYGLHRIDVEHDLKIHLIDAAERVLPGLPEKVSNSTAEVLRALNIQIHTQEFIASAHEDRYETRDGKTISAEIKVWAAGVRGDDVLTGLDELETTPTQQLLVHPTLQTTRDESIFAFGDCAACPMGESGWVPPRAQAAHQQAAVVAKNIASAIDGRSLLNYEYKDFGSLINLSQRGTIGNLMGNLLRRKPASFPVEGYLARWVYLSLYKLHQVQTNGYIRTGLLTLANILTRASKPRLKLH